MAAQPGHRAGPADPLERRRPGARHARRPGVRRGAAQHRRHRGRDDPRPRFARSAGRPGAGDRGVALAPGAPRHGRATRLRATPPQPEAAAPDLSPAPLSGTVEGSAGGYGRRMTNSSDPTTEQSAEPLDDEVDPGDLDMDGGKAAEEWDDEQLED